MSRRISIEPDDETFVAVDHRGAPVGPIQRVALAITRGTGELHPSPSGTLVVHVDSFGREVMRVPTDAVIFGDLDAVEQWQLTPREA